MATAKKNDALTDVENTPEFIPEDPKRKVKIKLPINRDRKDPGVYVSVNNYSCLIKRGEEVEVPWFVAEALRDSEDAEMTVYKFISANSK